MELHREQYWFWSTFDKLSRATHRAASPWDFPAGLVQPRKALRSAAPWPGQRRQHCVPGQSLLQPGWREVMAIEEPLGRWLERERSFIGGRSLSC